MDIGTPIRRHEVVPEVIPEETPETETPEVPDKETEDG